MFLDASMVPEYRILSSIAIGELTLLVTYITVNRGGKHKYLIQLISPSAFIIFSLLAMQFFVSFYILFIYTSSQVKRSNSPLFVYYYHPTSGCRVCFQLQWLLPAIFQMPPLSLYLANPADPHIVLIPVQIHCIIINTTPCAVGVPYHTAL